MEQQITTSNQPIAKMPYATPEISELGTVEQMTQETVQPSGSGKIACMFTK